MTSVGAEQGESGESFETRQLFVSLSSLAVLHGTIAETEDVKHSWTFVIEDIPPLSLPDTKWRICYTSAQEVEDGARGDMLEVEARDGELVKSITFFQDQETGEFTSVVDYTPVHPIPRDPAETAMAREALEAVLNDTEPTKRMLQLFGERMRFHLAIDSEPSPDDLAVLATLAKGLAVWFQQ